jgi:Holliday junction resolvase
MKYSKKDLKNWRRRGFYNENALVTFLQKRGYNAVRIPCSNPSMNPLPDVMSRKDMHVYAYETKKAKYYCYFEPHQIEKLFRFLDELMPLPNQYKHAVLVAHIGKKWIFKTVPWADRNTFTENFVIKKSQHSEKIP